MERFTKHWEFKVCEMWEGADVVESLRCRAIAIRKFFPYHAHCIQTIRTKSRWGRERGFKIWVRL